MRPTSSRAVAGLVRRRGHREEDGQREQREPHGGEQHGRPHVLTVGSGDSEESAGIAVARDDAEIDDQQQHDTAGIAHAGTEPGDAARCLRRRELAQHRVVGHGRELRARGGAPEQHQAQPQVVVVVAHQAHRRGQQHHHPGEQRQHATAPPRRVDPDTGERSQHCDHDAATRQCPEQPALRCRPSG